MAAGGPNEVEKPEARLSGSRSPHPARARALRWLSTALAVAATGCGAVALTTSTGASRDGIPAPAVLGAAAVAVALALAVVQFLRPGVEARRWAGAALILSVAVGAYVWWQAWLDVAGGLPTRALPLLAGALVLAAGACLAALLPGKAPPKAAHGARPAGMVVAAAAGVVGVLLVSGAAVALERLPVDHQSVTPGDAAPVATPPRDVAWSWDTPPGWRVGRDDVVPAGPGVAVRVADGVVALDGRTGAPRWHYRRAGAHTVQIGASPSGDWVMVTFRASSPHATGVRVVALDGQTGRVGFDEVTTGGVFHGVSLDLTDHVLVGGDPDDGRIEGFDLADGRRLWQWRRPQECFQYGLGPAAAATAETVLAIMACEQDRRGLTVVGDVALVALDSRTGAERWRYATPFEYELLAPDAPVQVETRLSMSRDRSAAWLSWYPPAGEAFEALVAAASGAVLAETEEDGQHSGLPRYFDADLVVSGDAEAAAYRIRTFADAGERLVPPLCEDDMVRGPVARVRETLLVHCYQPAGQILTVFDWREAGDPWQIAVDLDARGSRRLLEVVALPAATVVVGPEVERIIGLG